jgi:hypothetical protein
VNNIKRGDSISNTKSEVIMAEGNFIEIITPTYRTEPEENER